jgi:hypothetical protein
MVRPFRWSPVLRQLQQLRLDRTHHDVFRPLDRRSNGTGTSIPVEEQRSLLSQFGQTALQTREIGRILQRARPGSRNTFRKGPGVSAGGKRLLVNAGVGWARQDHRPGILGIDRSLPPAMLSIPAISSFPTTFKKIPAFERRNCCQSTVNVLIVRGGEGHLPFGALKSTARTWAILI